MRWVPLVIVFSTLVFAGGKDERAPLPKKLTDAKSVYIDNKSNRADIGDAAYKEIKKLTRYTVVDAPETADVIFQLTYYEDPVETPVMGIISGSTVILPKERGCSVTLKILDAKDKDRNQIWGNTKPCGRHGATEDIFKDLRSRLQ